ncbi:hypothetical protein H5410_036766 [Solanum commersonii]|uniref:Uncharacterized protein n=1 Tax=Solanum commersonii TaxID=4109 RepID=A0A9J5Y961_SOLCO|nr:hypothetical protein H5410_036766 [Solanum commersonii]
MCGVGETSELETPPTKVLVSLEVGINTTHHSQDKTLSYSHTESRVKPSTNENPVDPDVTSQPCLVSSTTSKRLFDGELPVEKGTMSKIITTEPTVNKSRPLFDQTPNIGLPIDFVQENLDEDEDIVPLTWKRKI